MLHPRKTRQRTDWVKAGQERTAVSSTLCKQDWMYGGDTRAVSWHMVYLGQLESGSENLGLDYHGSSGACHRSCHYCVKMTDKRLEKR